MIVVANAGPLIALAQIGRLDILPALYGEIRIPRAVWMEVVTHGHEQAGAASVRSAPWIKVADVRDKIALRLLRERLDEGESAAILLAIELRAKLLLIDEARGRRIAEARGLNKTGTVGTLVLAKQRGLVQAVTPLLDSLMTSGFHMSDELYRTARMLAGEV